MATTVYQYKIWCTTENKFVYAWSTNNTLSVCPNNNTHVIDQNSLSVDNKISDNEVFIKEEQTPTGGHFAIKHIKLDIPPNTTNICNVFWNHPISALSLSYVPKSYNIQDDDEISLVIGKNTIIGTTTTNISPCNLWISQNYLIGQIVMYDDGIFGNRPFTCIKNTVANEVPINKTYWQLGFEINCSSSVINNIKIGYYVNLYDSINSNDMGEVVHINTINNKIYVNGNPSNTFNYLTPTYIRQSIYIFKNMMFDEIQRHDIGKSKIGGAYIPTNTNISLEYTNKSLVITKKFIGYVEYLY